MHVPCPPLQHPLTKSLDCSLGQTLTLLYRGCVSVGAVPARPWGLAPPHHLCLKVGRFSLFRAERLYLLLSPAAPAGFSATVWSGHAKLRSLEHGLALALLPKQRGAFFLTWAQSFCLICHTSKRLLSTLTNLHRHLTVTMKAALAVVAVAGVAAAADFQPPKGYPPCAVRYALSGDWTW